jgi:hypothetical protein
MLIAAIAAGPSSEGSDPVCPKRVRAVFGAARHDPVGCEYRSILLDETPHSVM